jgi:predicted restriction endonuclease
VKVFYIITDKRDFSKLSKLTQSCQWQIHSKYIEIFNKIQKNDLILFSKESHYSWDVILKLKEKQIIKIKNNDDSEFRERAKTLSFKFQNKDYLSEYLNSFDVPNLSKSKPGLYFYKNISSVKKQVKSKETKRGIPEKIFSIVKHSKRDKNKVRDLKLKYLDKCQICNYSLILENGKHHSEVHHLRPVGKELGNDDTNNMIVLCPNHHKAFDYSVLRIDLSGSKVIDLDENEIAKIKFKNDHKLSKENITYQYYRRMI